MSPYSFLSRSFHSIISLLFIGSLLLSIIPIIVKQHDKEFLETTMRYVFCANCCLSMMMLASTPLRSTKQRKKIGFFVWHFSRGILGVISFMMYGFTQFVPINLHLIPFWSPFFLFVQALHLFVYWHWFFKEDRPGSVSSGLATISAFYFYPIYWWFTNNQNIPFYVAHPSLSVHLYINFCVLIPIFSANDSFIQGLKHSKKLTDKQYRTWVAGAWMTYAAISIIQLLFCYETSKPALIYMTVHVMYLLLEKVVVKSDYLNTTYYKLTKAV